MEVRRTLQEEVRTVLLWIAATVVVIFYLMVYKQGIVYGEAPNGYIIAPFLESRIIE